jgi:hypothetical protein
VRAQHGVTAVLCQGRRGSLHTAGHRKEPGAGRALGRAWHTPTSAMNTHTRLGVTTSKAHTKKGPTLRYLQGNSTLHTIFPTISPNQGSLQPG